MEVRILYSGVGDTDPIRECRDGAILQIIRAYHPEKAVLFLSKDMTAKEEAYQRYTKPIEAVDPSCAIELIKTDIVNVHKIDSLYQMVDEFYRLIDRYPDDEFLINTSSGTPQMKMIMAMLAIEYEKATAIQVDSPQRGSNRNTHALNDDATVEEIIENNLDSDPEEYRNRCSEPKLRFIKYRQVARELEKLTQAYSYKDALELANKNRDIISTEVIALLQHAYKRSNLEIQEAADAIKGKKDLHEFAIPHDTDNEVTKLREYLGIMEIRMKQEYRQDFFVKMSPFLYELLKWYIVKRLHIPLEKFTGDKKSTKLNLGLIEENFPAYIKVLDREFGYAKDRQEMSYYNLELFLQSRDEVPDDIKEKLRFLRDVERKIRNQQAHQIEPLTEKMVRNTVGDSTFNIFQDIRAVFTFALGEDRGAVKGLVYDKINEKIRELLKEE